MLPRNRGRTEERKPTSTNRTTQQNEEHNRTSRPDAPDAALSSRMQGTEERNGSPQPHKTRRQGTRKGKGSRNTTRERSGATREAKKGKAERSSDQPTSPQKRGTPPLRQVKTSCFPPQKFAPKNQQKVAWGGFEKIFGKIFRENVSG